MSADQCEWSPDCEHGRHERNAHPCGTRPEAPGTACRFCGEPVPMDGTPCPDCWTSLDGMNMADLKGVFASMDLSLEGGPGE